MTKNKFKAYLKVQKSGKVNMFDWRGVSSLSRGVLGKEDIIDIMDNYTKYQKEYGLTTENI